MDPLLEAPSGYRRVTSMPRSAFEGLEPYDGNLSRTVLRGLGARNGPWLPGVLTSTVFIRYSQYSAPRAHFYIKVCVTAQKMREGPSEPACRSRLQTT